MDSSFISVKIKDELIKQIINSNKYYLTISTHSQNIIINWKHVIFHSNDKKNIFYLYLEKEKTIKLILEDNTKMFEEFFSYLILKIDRFAQIKLNNNHITIQGDKIILDHLNGGFLRNINNIKIEYFNIKDNLWKLNMKDDKELFNCEIIKEELDKLLFMLKM